jgi:hypothetical protein
MARRPKPTRRDALAPYLVGRNDASGARRGQGIVQTWDAANGENTVSFRGQTHTNMPFLAPGNTIPDYDGGDIVVIEGWAPEGRLSSWYIVGRVFIPPVTP